MLGIKLPKLFYTYLWLAGAIEADTKEGGQGWRDDITPALDKAGIYTQDPCKTEPLVTGMNVLEAQDQFNKWIMSGNYDKFAEKLEKIVQKDIRMVHRSDFVIVHLFPDIPTTGTIHEMAEAWRIKRPLYLIWKDAKSKVPKWALYLVTSSGGQLFDNGKQLTDFIALKYNIKNQSLRIQVIQFCKSICRLIGEKVYTYKLNKIKKTWTEKKIIKEAPVKPEEKKEKKEEKK